VRPEPAHFLTATPATANMSVLLKGIQVEGKICALTSDGLRVGASVINGSNVGIALWGDDPSTDKIDGLRDGEAFELRLWNANTGQEQDLSPAAFHRGNELIYEADGVLVLEVESIISIPVDFYLSDAFPNPFNSVTKLIYGLPEAGFVSITIYDITGRIVHNLVNTNQIAGYHNVIWDAGLSSSGLYIVRMKAEGFSSTRKVVLTK